jgi:hypothetical protein
MAASNRAIGVLTKLDRMAKEMDARDLLLNKVYPLKLGYISVLNRSQPDIIGKKSTGAAFRAEKRSFTKTPRYGDVAANCGTEFSIINLNQLLMLDIKSKLLSLYAQINSLFEAKRGELEAYGVI